MTFHHSTGALRESARRPLIRMCSWLCIQHLRGDSVKSKGFTFALAVVCLLGGTAHAAADHLRVVALSDTQVPGFAPNVYYDVPGVPFVDRHGKALFTATIYGEGINGSEFATIGESSQPFAVRTGETYVVPGTTFLMQPYSTTAVFDFNGEQGLIRGRSLLPDGSTAGDLLYTWDSTNGLNLVVKPGDRLHVDGVATDLMMPQAQRVTRASPDARLGKDGTLIYGGSYPDATPGYNGAHPAMVKYTPGIGNEVLYALGEQAPSIAETTYIDAFESAHVTANGEVILSARLQVTGGVTGNTDTVFYRTNSAGDLVPFLREGEWFSPHERHGRLFGNSLIANDQGAVLFRSSFGPIPVQSQDLGIFTDALGNGIELLAEDDSATSFCLRGRIDFTFQGQRGHYSGNL